ncbi:AI-2E family transporter [Rossellomorea aquimaris]|uniref:AI-2E family transporter n=1 Tax=Rossellomorea aquimaris TaxID=189382 RepID=A0A1J6WKX6_9BACI|nr:AI-2E family transporter [Rossellomorea aquimaris]OIU68631.1 AI-2E family transporter [Rossellomorea aquimaris]
MAKSKLYRWSIQILIILTIIYVATKVQFLFQPIGVLFSTIFFPIIIAGFLYFLLNPLVNLLEKLKLPRTVAILVLYALIIGVISLIIGNIAPIITKQVTGLINDMPDYVRQTRDYIIHLSESDQFKWMMNQDYVPLEDIEKRLGEYANTLPDNITAAITGFFGILTSIAITIVTVPFLLFFMFKDGHKLPHAIAKFMPDAYREEGLKTLHDTNDTLGAYIQGQLLVGLFVGTLTFIGYLIIGLPYALVMALIGAVTNIIPYLGPFLGAAPAVVIALFDSPTKAILVVVVILIAQQIEGNVLSPLILGKSLDTHPATIIILLLVAGNLAGILGMILAIPTYAVAKTIVVNTVKFIRMRRYNLSELKKE